MRVGSIGLSAVLTVIGLAASPARAADPAAAQAPIHGTDAMGDKGRSGPDGWASAPQTRSQAPADKSGQAAAAARQDLNSLPAPAAGKALKPGDDPGTPLATGSNGPETIDGGAARKP